MDELILKRKAQQFRLLEAFFRRTVGNPSHQLHVTSLASLATNAEVPARDAAIAWGRLCHDGLLANDDEFWWLTPKGVRAIAPKIDFAILTAIEVERRAVCATFGLGDDHRVKKEARVYWRGRLPLKSGEFYELVVAQSPDVANIDAALLTSDLLHDWLPSAALLVGIAASTKPGEVKLGDVVVASDVYYYERGKITPQGTKPEPKMVPADTTLWGNVKAVPDWNAELSVQRPDATSDHPKLHFGVIASGEKVLADEVARDHIAAGHRKILALGMEDHGFSKAIWQSYDRVRHLVIRGICDDGTPAKDDKWHQYAAASAADFAKHFLKDRPLPPRTLNEDPGAEQPEASPPAKFEAASAIIQEAQHGIRWSTRLTVFARNTTTKIRDTHGPRVITALRDLFELFWAIAVVAAAMLLAFLFASPFRQIAPKFAEALTVVLFVGLVVLGERLDGFYRRHRK